MIISDVGGARPRIARMQWWPPAVPLAPRQENSSNALALGIPGSLRCGSGMFILDPNIFHPRSWIPDLDGQHRIEREIEYFYPKLLPSFRKYDPGCYPWFRIPDQDSLHADFESREWDQKARDPGFRIHNEAVCKSVFPMRDNLFWNPDLTVSRRNWQIQIERIFIKLKILFCWNWTKTFSKMP